jgi:hypothetical protein
MGINIEDSINNALKKFDELIDEYKKIDKEWAVWIKKIIMRF